MTEALEWLTALPNTLVYLVLAAGAATENVLPAVPADSFVALGGFLAGAGDLDVRWVAVTTWLANTSAALAVYRLSHLRGPGFFAEGVGRHLVRPHQMERLTRFYERWGLPAIFLSRFLPGVRAFVPVFAGATHQPLTRVAPPIAVASAIWYGGLVWLGLWAGRNVEQLAQAVGGINRTLAVVAGVIGVLVAAWWWRTRHPPHG